jgi:heme oxygenase
MSAAPPGDVLAALRAATAERHDSVDRCMPLSRPTLTIDDYIEHLVRMRAWLQPLEQWLEDSAAYTSSCLPPIRQTALIDADLTFALSSVSHQREPSLRPHRWPAQAPAPYRWGARYVIEGSRLGAAVLYRRLSYALRPHPLHYLRGDDGASPSRWPNFQRELRSGIRTSADIAAACKGACDSFDALLALCRAPTCVAPVVIERS